MGPRDVRRCVIAIGAVLLAASLQAEPRSAAEDRLPPPGGRIERLPSREDPDQSYALYLPEGYSAERGRPILYCFDPRGRGALCLDLFVEGAARHGWIVASSNNSRSDGPFEPNRQAMLAIWRDTHERLSIDPERIYAAGFSGGSRVANILGQMVGAAGVIGCGGGFPPSAPATAEVPFDYFGLVGNEDFNYYEMRTLDRGLDGLGIVHRIEIFEGGHRWAPEAWAGTAIDWMEFRAMARGARPIAPAFVAEYLRAEWEAITALDEAGRPDDALTRLIRLREDLSGLPGEGGGLADEVETVTSEIERLEQAPRVRGLRRERERWDRRGEAYLDKLAAVLARLRGPGPRPGLDRLTADLDLPRLLRQAERGDTEEARYARRVLAMVQVQGASTQYRAFVSEQRWDRAALSLELALRIRPENGVAWYNLACARARGGKIEPALQALTQAFAHGFARCDLARDDPDLESVRGLPGFVETMERCGAGGDAGAAPLTPRS